MNAPRVRRQGQHWSPARRRRIRVQPRPPGQAIAAYECNRVDSGDEWPGWRLGGFARGQAPLFRLGGYTRGISPCSYMAGFAAAGHGQTGLFSARTAHVVCSAGATSRGGRLYLHSLREAACRMLCKAPYASDIGADALFTKKRQAIATIFERLDPEICATCKARVFEECTTRPPRDVAPAEQTT